MCWTISWPAPRWRSTTASWAAWSRTAGKGSVVVRVTQTQRKGFKMKPERGLTFPRADLHLDPLTADDLTDLDFVARHADLIGYLVRAKRR